MVLTGADAPGRMDVARARGWWSAWLIVLMLACGAVSVAHGADAMWDLKNYHLYNPFAALHRRYDWDVAPAQIQSYFNPLLDFPFYLAVRSFDDHPRTIAFLMGLPQGLNLWLLSLIAWRICPGPDLTFRLPATGLVTAMGATGAGTLPLIGATTGDLLVSVPVLAALVCLVPGTADRSGGLRPIILAGLLAGAAVGAKPTTACYALGLLAATAVAAPSRRRIAALVFFAAGGALGVVITGASHAVRMARAFGSPLFPLFNDVFRSPFFETASARDVRFLPKTIAEAVSYPFEWASDPHRALVSEVPFRDIRVALALLVIVAIGVAKGRYLLLRGRRPEPSRPAEARWPAAGALPVFFVVSYGVWLALFAVYRYLLPLEMLSGVVVLAGIVRLAPRSMALPALGLVCSACWATTVPLEWGHTRFGDRYIAVDAPPLAPGTLVLVVGDDPVSFLAPFMDRSARWLSLDNNFLNPSQANGLVARERDVVARHGGPMVVLFGSGREGRVSTILPSFALAADLSDCADVSTSLGGQTYRLCPVHRSAG